MNFEEAEKRLDAMAPGKHIQVGYNRSTFCHTGKPFQEQECRIYVTGHPFCIADNWEEALKEMQNLLNPPKKMDLAPETVEELPQLENGDTE